ncbi:MAG: DUF3037 domain-containing protein [Bacteroidales bacterium]|nr:DUF3037 domain-containing protein [Bacteroidales bacterium]
MEKIIYEYSILRCVPDIERGEFLNVGLMMMSKRQRWLQVRVNIDTDRLRILSPRLDCERLRIQLEAFLRTDVPFPSLPVEERYRWLAAVKSALIQTSPSHPGILLSNGQVKAMDLLEEKFRELYQRLVLMP